MTQLDKYNQILAKYDQLLTDGKFDDAAVLSKEHDLIALRTVFVAIACDRDEACQGITTQFFLALCEFPEEQQLYTMDHTSEASKKMRQRLRELFRDDCLEKLILNEGIQGFFIHAWLKKIKKFIDMDL